MCLSLSRIVIYISQIRYYPFLIDISMMNHDFQIQFMPPAVYDHDRSRHSESDKLLDGFSSEFTEDKALSLKIKYVNHAIDEIGFTSYQVKLFFLNGFGYAVDSLLIVLNALTQPQVALQYQPVVSTAQTMAVGVGLLLGALCWGIGADVSSIV